HHRLEHMTQEVAVTEAAVAINRERRVIRHLVIEIEPAEPPICEMQREFLAQLPLEANAVAITYKQHPDHKLGVNRRSADLAVERLQLLAQVSRRPRYDRVDPAQQMARRNALFEIKQIEQLALLAGLPAHHGPSPSLRDQTDGITGHPKPR